MSFREIFCFLFPSWHKGYWCVLLSVALLGYWEYELRASISQGKHFYLPSHSHHLCVVLWYDTDTPLLGRCPKVLSSYSTDNCSVMLIAVLITDLGNKNSLNALHQRNKQWQCGTSTQSIQMQKKKIEVADAIELRSRREKWHVLSLLWAPSLNLLMVHDRSKNRNQEKWNGTLVRRNERDRNRRMGGKGGGLNYLVVRRGIGKGKTTMLENP